MVSYKKLGRGSSHDFWHLVDFRHQRNKDPLAPLECMVSKLETKSRDEAAPMTFDWCPVRWPPLLNAAPPPITSQSQGRKISQEQSRGRWRSFRRFCNLLFLLSRGALFHLSFPPYGWSCHWTKSLGAFINVESSVGIFLKLYWRFFPFLWTFF